MVLFRVFYSEHMGATQVAQWHGSALRAEFDHSPMAPPIVHPSNGVNHCRTSSVGAAGWESRV